MSRKKRIPFFRRMVFLGLKVLFVLWILTLIQVASLRFLNPPLTATMLWARIQGENPRAHAWLTPSWRRLGRISPHLRKAVLAGEDQRFLSHHGFDFTEMNRAIRQLAMKKGIRGASTISMQVARTVFLWPARTWFRKLAEAYYTFLIEIFWTKQRILEMYLNTVDWGNGIRGAQAASERYFHVPARDISPSQAALLAAVLPSPHRWSPVHPNARVLRRQRRILRDMRKMPLVS